MTTVCLACDQANPDGSSFCSACGRPLSVARPASPVSSSTPFVGRERELTILKSKLDEAAAGHGSLWCKRYPDPYNKYSDKRDYEAQRAWQIAPPFGDAGRRAGPR